MVEYRWVHKISGNSFMVSQWNETPRWIDASRAHVKPDLDQGAPVVRKIGTGRIAQYYRFEWCRASEAAE